MDAKDRQILRVLQADGRMTNQDLAAKVNLSPSPCLRRVRLLEQAGAITGYHATLSAKAYGLPVTVYVRISLERHSEDLVRGFEAAIVRLDAVQECHLMTGAADYLLRVMVASLEAYEDFIRKSIHRIPGISSIDSSFVYGTIKQDGVFPEIPS